MPAIEWPTSTQPGTNITENGGRLINAYAEPAPAGSRSQVIWRSAPGLFSAFVGGLDDYRGSVLVGSTLYVINGTGGYKVTEALGVYTVTDLSGTIAGDGPVFMSRNMNATPQILIVHSDGMSQIIADTLSDFTDPDLPAANSICYLDGYFIVTSAAGKAYASGINAVTFNGLDFTIAEAQPDGLVRAVAFGRDLLLMGETTVEFWSNTGNAVGFPFSRGQVLQLGLLGPYAVAGQEYGFPGDLVWVASDRTVRRLNGYTPEHISPPKLDRLLLDVVDTTQLKACVYISAGHAFWSLSSATWTWVFDLTTGNWHERATLGSTLWRAASSIYAFSKWVVFDLVGSAAFTIMDRYRYEGAKQLVWEIRSNQAHRFPGRSVIKRASFDFVTGVGTDVLATPILSDPQVSISWSFDGGRTWSQPILRQLGTQGELRKLDIFRLGLTRRFGVQFRLQVADPIEVGFLGAATDVEDRAA